MVTTTLLQRVLLLEDDASIRRFVAMALELLPIELIECVTVAEAMAALRQAPVRLLITDLMLRNESGLDLLNEIQREPALLGDGLVAVFSAGLGAPVLKQLAGHRVWRLLSKPTPIAMLERCVGDALAAAVGSPLAATPLQEPPKGGNEDDAVQLHFNGDLRLFTAYRASCLAQFPHDMASAESAVARHDAAGLRRIGHSLKTVLKMLGQREVATLAQSLDDAAAGTDWPAARLAWRRLRQGLDDLLRP